MTKRALASAFFVRLTKGGSSQRGSDLSSQLCYTHYGATRMGACMTTPNWQLQTANCRLQLTRTAPSALIPTRSSYLTKSS